jgi:CubicO group peptidase (beta-lactamase class C family)
VVKHIATFPYKDITLRMLLNHRSGLADYIHLMVKPKDKKYLNNNDR